MRYVRLGKTDVEVSAVAFGTWSFGGDWARSVKPIPPSWRSRPSAICDRAEL
jgi:aryl-alcohol dehydrogenase-like predicted oxidoreductase